MATCVEQGNTVWGVKPSLCPFDTLFAKLDPRLWAHSMPLFFQDSTRHPGFSLYNSGVDGWSGELFEHVSVMVLLFDIQNMLMIDYKKTRSTFPRMARVDYSLAQSLDGKMTLNQGQLHIFEQVVNGQIWTMVYFGKAAKFEDPFPSYCADMTSFMQMGAEQAANACL